MDNDKILHPANKVVVHKKTETGIRKGMRVEYVPPELKTVICCIHTMMSTRHYRPQYIVYFKIKKYSC